MKFLYFVYQEFRAPELINLHFVYLEFRAPELINFLLFMKFLHFVYQEFRAPELINFLEGILFTTVSFFLRKTFENIWILLR